MLQVRDQGAPAAHGGLSNPEISQQLSGPKLNIYRALKIFGHVKPGTLSLVCKQPFSAPLRPDISQVPVGSRLHLLPGR